MTRQQIYPYAMPVAYAVAGLILVVGMCFIAARALLNEWWDAVWESMG